MIDSGDELNLDQTHLETVIPAPGKSLCRPFNAYAINMSASIHQTIAFRHRLIVIDTYLLSRNT